MAESNLISLCGAGEGRLQGDYPGIRGSKCEAFILCHWQKCVAIFHKPVERWDVRCVLC